MRITAVISTLGAGGAERVMAGLASGLAAAGDEVRLVSFAAPDEPLFHPLDPRVELIRLGGVGASASPVRRTAALLARLHRLRRAIRDGRPDVVVSFIDVMNVQTLLMTRGLGIPVIVSERIDPAAYAHRIGAVKSGLRDRLYGRAARVVVQTERARCGLPRVAPDRIAVIANPVWPAERRAAPDRPGPTGRWRMLAAGRLDPQKGFDLLIAAFARLADRHPDWDLAIFGEGAGRPSLEGRIAAAGLADRIALPGITRRLGEEMAASHLLAFPSRYEGFPNVLAEAMATGLPGVAFAGVSGVEELVADGTTGLLVPMAEDVAALAGALDRLMGDASLRAALGAAAVARVAAWSPDVVLGQWRALIADVAGRHRRR